MSFFTTLPASAQAAAPALPATLDGKAFWYDLRTGFVTSAAGDIVTATDRFGLAATLNQGTGSARPALDPNAIDTGQEGGSFDGVDERLPGSGATWTGNAMTLYCAINVGSVPASAGAVSTVLSWTHASSAGVGGFVIRNVSGDAKWEWTYRKVGTTAIPRASAVAPSTGKQTIIIQHGAAADRLWINGVSQTIVYRSGSFFADMSGTTGDYAVGQTVTSTGYFTGGIAAVIGYNAEHDASTIADMHAYLTSEYL